MGSPTDRPRQKVATPSATKRPAFCDGRAAWITLVGFQTVGIELMSSHEWGFITAWHRLWDRGQAAIVSLWRGLSVAGDKESFTLISGRHPASRLGYGAWSVWSTGVQVFLGDDAGSWAAVCDFLYSFLVGVSSQWS